MTSRHALIRKNLASKSKKLNKIYILGLIKRGNETENNFAFNYKFIERKRLECL